MMIWERFFTNVTDVSRNIVDVTVEMGKLEINLTFENVPDESSSYPCRCWDVPVAYEGMETRSKFTFYTFVTTVTLH